MSTATCDRDSRRRAYAAYADTFRLLLDYAKQATGIAPPRWHWPTSTRTSSAGSSSIWKPTAGTLSPPVTPVGRRCDRFFTYASYRAPDAIATISQVRAIPAKRTRTTLVSFLTAPEAVALITAPDTGTWLGRRDRLLLHLGIQTGLCQRADQPAHRQHHRRTAQGTRMRRKGRKQRVIPLQKNTTKLITARLAELPPQREGPLFPTSTGTALTRAAVGKLVTRHATTTAERCPSLAGKNVTPHTLRHTCAMSPASRRNRYREHRDLARSREHPDHADLPPHRPRTQTTHPRTSRCARRTVTRSLPSLRRSHRVPQEPLTPARLC